MDTTFKGLKNNIRNHTMAKVMKVTGYDYNLVVNGTVYASATLPEQDDAKPLSRHIQYLT